MAFREHTATFAPGAPEREMRSDLACRTCGHFDPGDSALRADDGRLRILCVHCVTFNTISVTVAQLGAVLARLHPEQAALPTELADRHMPPRRIRPRLSGRKETLMLIAGG
jgi:hypothetical protein